MRLPEFRLESLFLFCLLTVAAFGLINLYSAGAGQAGIFPRQAVATCIGAVVCLALAATDYRLLRKFSFFFYVIGTLLLLGTALVGHEVKSTRAWLSFGFFSVQPSELFKGVFILHLAAYLSQIRREHRETLIRGLVVPVILLAIPVALILKQRDTGTAAVYVPIFFAMLYIAELKFTLVGVTLTIGAVAGATAGLRVYAQTLHPGWVPDLQKYISLPYSGPIFAAALILCLLFFALRLRYTHFRGGRRTKLAMLALFILFAGIQTGEGFYRSLKPHQKNRIASFFQPQIDPRGAGYQALQAEIAVGSGGVFGKGYLKGTQKRLGFLPEQWTDFAFSVVAEEWGFVGSFLTLLIYGLLIGSALWIARNATDLYGCLLATGTATLYFIHMGVGVAMNIGSFPVVGIPMPFLSYGGSAQILNFAMAGIVLSVARYRRLLAA